MLRQPSEKVLPPSMDTANLPDDFLEREIALLFFQHAQATQQRQAGIDQRRNWRVKVVRTLVSPGHSGRES